MFKDIVDEAVKNELLGMPVSGWMCNVLNGGDPLEYSVDKVFVGDTSVRMDV